MANGYAGKILKVDLTTREIEEIPTSKYEEWGGGHGMGSALFYDLCEDPSVTGDDPKNVLTLMASPLSGTLTPGAAARCEVQGIGLQGYPRAWFTRSNFGGRFTTQLKQAGWDGVALTGKADSQVWINIVDGKVTIEDATDLWGLDTFETQQQIHSRVTELQGEWNALTEARDGGRTTQQSAVVTVGPNADTYAPMCALVHDAGNGAGQGGFGGVMALKNVKAISVLGTGGVEIADPAALMKARSWIGQYAAAGHIDELSPMPGNWAMPGNPGQAAAYYTEGMKSRPQGCVGCIRACRARNDKGIANESHCTDYFMTAHGITKEGGLSAADQVQRLSLNAYTMNGMTQWLIKLHKEGILGKGKEINTEIPFERILESDETVLMLMDSIVKQYDIGADLAKGVWQAAQKWGRFEQDTATGWLAMDVWGYMHHYDPRTELEWGFGSLMGDRDINEHDFNWITYWGSTIWALYGMDPVVSAERMAEICISKMPPYTDEPRLIDYSDENRYSETMAKFVSWHRSYTRYYKESLGYCDWLFADFVNPYGPDMVGCTGEAEPKFFNAVTGNNQSFEEGIAVGHRIWHLDRAIWALQGRTRELEVFSGYIYEVGSTDTPGRDYAGISYELPYIMPTYGDGKWSYKNHAGRMHDRQGVEDWKTIYYGLEGWDKQTGQPTRESLESQNLGYVADRLESAGVLGKA